jgi:hypothetical protein
MLKRNLLLAIVFVLSIFLSGCIYIPPNEHVGKPAPHNYNFDRTYTVNHYYHRY